jgi:uncharacterized membrane protein YfhO
MNKKHRSGRQKVYNPKTDRRFRQRTGFSGLMYRIFADNRQYFLAFFLPALILLGAYFAFGVFPFGKESVLSLDLNGQYVYYYDYMYDVLAGKESVFYSWSRNLSGEFMGIIGYYLASPFNFLVWAFPRDMITEGLLTMMVVKAGAISLCASIYLRHGRGFSRLTSVIFPIMYALCAYSIVQTMNPMWLDGVGVLPLVVMGVEAFVKKGRFKLLALSLVYAFVTSFYIGFMIAIFTALYFLYYLVACDEFDHMSGGAIFARLGGFACVALTAAAMSAFMILPVVNSLSLGKFTFSTPDYTIQQNFNLANVAQKFFPNSYDTVRMEGLPFLYAGVLTVVMGVCFFLSGKISGLSRRRRMCSAVLLLVLTVCMYIRPVDMMWHGGQLPNWLPYRYSFVLTFLIVAWAAEAFDHVDEISEKLIAGAAIAFAAVGVYIEQLDTYNPELGNKGGREMFDGITVLLPAILLILIITFTVISRKSWFKAGKVSMFLIALLVCGEAFYNTLAQVAKQDADIVYSDRESYADVILPTREVVQNIKAADDGFYRIEKNYFRTVNDPLALQMYGLSHSSSTLNDKPIALLGKLGLTSRSHYTCYRGATPIVDDLFGVKYILSSPGNETGRITDVGDIEVETNSDAMPIAYLASPMISNLDLDLYVDDEVNIFRRQNRIMSAMIGEGAVQDYMRVIDPGLLEITTQNIDITNVSGGHTAYKTHTKGKDSYVEISLTAEADGELFMWLPSDYERKVNVYLYGRTFAGQYYESDYYCAKSLGEFNRGDYVTVRLSLTKDELYIKDYLFGYMDWDAYNTAIARLNDMNRETEVYKFSPTNLKIKVNADRFSTLLTTIPSEPGWKVTVDGAAVEIGESLDSLISIPITEGVHVIDMTFTTGYYPLALYITAGGTLLFILACLTQWLILRRRRKIRPNPGGDDDDYNALDDDSAYTGDFADDYENSDDDGFADGFNAFVPVSSDSPPYETAFYSPGVFPEYLREDAESDREESFAKPKIEAVNTKQTKKQRKAEEKKQKALLQSAEKQRKAEALKQRKDEQAANRKAKSAKKNKKSRDSSLASKNAGIAPIAPIVPNAGLPETEAAETDAPDDYNDYAETDRDIIGAADESEADGADMPDENAENAENEDLSLPDLNRLEQRQYDDMPEESTRETAADPAEAENPAEETETEIPDSGRSAYETIAGLFGAEHENEQSEQDEQDGESAQMIQPIKQEDEIAAPVFIPLDKELPVMNDGDGIDAVSVNFDEDMDESNEDIVPARQAEDYDRIKTDKTIHEILNTILSVNEDVPENEESEEGAEKLFPDDQIEKL